MRNNGLKNGRKKGLKRICVCTAAVLLLCSCGQKEEEDNILTIERDGTDLTYEYGMAEIGDMVKTEKIRCTYRQMNEEEVSFSLTGRLVDRVYVQEGDSVKKGDLLAELSSKELERAIEDLEYDIARYELLLSYTDINEEYDISGYWVNYLYYSGMSQYDKEYLESRIESTQQAYRYLREDYSDIIEADKKELEKLKQELCSSRIYAGIDGVIFKMKSGLEGSTSEAGEVVINIYDTSLCLFEASTPEAAGYFTEGETVSMTIYFASNAGQYELMPWHMDEWGEKQWFSIYSSPEEANLEVGTTGSIEVVSARRQDVLKVPKEAVHPAGDANYVYVMNSDNIREVKWIETGLYGDDAVEILDGLTEGERVILK
ncbi:MAG: efflux RND transporter periplasmic adaptor subunit [Acetatifactor sp.]|nr:efflux RND transporter periplasmic adaptor subunit [Acetatifactor sp.]